METILLLPDIEVLFSPQDDMKSLRPEDRISIVQQVTRQVEKSLNGLVENAINGAIGPAVQKAVNDALASPPPGPFQAFALWAKNWGILAALIGAIIAMFGITLTAVYQLTSVGREQAKFEGTTSERLKNIDEKLTTFGKDLDRLLNKDSAAILLNKDSSPKEIAEAAQSLKARNGIVPLPEVEKVALAMVQESETGDKPDSWQAAQKVVDYVSFLNQRHTPSLDNPQPPTFHIEVNMQPLNGNPVQIPNILAAGWAPSNDADRKSVV